MKNIRIKKVVQYIFIFLAVFFLSACKKGEILSEQEFDTSTFNQKFVCAYAKMYGYVRYFHPTPQSQDLDWNKFVIYSLDKIQGINDENEFKDLMHTLFSPICYNLTFHNGGMAIPDTLIDSTDSYYLHYGLLHTKANVYERFIVNVDSCDYKQRPLSKFITKELLPDFYASLPLTIPKSYQPKIDSVFFKAVAFKFVDNESADDRVTQIGAMIQTWNIFKHFYPYHDIVQVDMDYMLTKNIQSICEHNYKHEAFHLLLSKFVAEMKDGHGSVGHRNRYMFKRLPFSCEHIDGKIIATNNFKTEILKGDEILSVNGIPIKKMFETQKEFHSGSKHMLEYYTLYALYYSYTDQKETVINISYLRNDTIGDIRIVRKEPYTPEEFEELNKEEEQMSSYRLNYTFKKLDSALYFVNLNRIEDEQWDSILPIIINANVIFDLRYYPSSKATEELIAHLTAETLKSPTWEIPIITSPDFENVTFTSETWDIAPKSPKFTGKLILLTSSFGISACETFVAFFDHYNLAPTVGTKTAGTNGNITRQKIVGGFKITFTGMKVRKHDGSQLHLVGFEPDYVVEPTIKGITENKDEQLEFAIDLINKGAK